MKFRKGNTQSNRANISFRISEKISDSKIHLMEIFNQHLQGQDTTQSRSFPFPFPTMKTVMWNTLQRKILQM